MSAEVREVRPRCPVDQADARADRRRQEAVAVRSQADAGDWRAEVIREHRTCAQILPWSVRRGDFSRMSAAQLAGSVAVAAGAPRAPRRMSKALTVPSTLPARTVDPSSASEVTESLKGAIVCAHGERPIEGHAGTPSAADMLRRPHDEGAAS